jgi:hypothetical protein
MLFRRTPPTLSSIATVCPAQMAIALWNGGTTGTAGSHDLSRTVGCKSGQSYRPWQLTESTHGFTGSIGCKVVTGTGLTSFIGSIGFTSSGSFTGSGSFTSTSPWPGTTGLFTSTGIRGIGITASSISSNLVVGLRRWIQAINRLAQGQTCHMPASQMRPSPSQPSPSQPSQRQSSGSRMLNSLGDCDRTSDYSPKPNSPRLSGLKLASLTLNLESNPEHTTLYQSGWWSPQTALTFS